MLEINVTTVLFTLVNFIVLFLLLRWLLMKPVGQLLETRRQTIAKDLDSARQSKDESQGLLSEHRELLAQGRTEARRIIDEAIRQGEIRRQEIMAAAAQEAEVFKARAQAEMQQQREQAAQELRQEVLSLSVALAEKMLARQVGPQDQDRLFAALLGELGEEYAKYGS